MTLEYMPDDGGRTKPKPGAYITPPPKTVPATKRKPAPKISNRPLTRKQKLFVQHLIENPKASGTEAAMTAYSTEDKPTAGAIAYENLKKPQIVSELAKYNNLVENTLINTVSEWGADKSTTKRGIAIDTAKFIHDKINGKAVQQMSVTSTSVNLSIDLSGSMGDWGDTEVQE